MMLAANTCDTVAAIQGTLISRFKYRCSMYGTVNSKVDFGLQENNLRYSTYTNELISLLMSLPVYQRALYVYVKTYRYRCAIG